MVRIHPRNIYERGADKERRIMNKARKAGFLSFRSAGSHSPIDVFILNPFEKIIELVQSKPRNISENAREKLIEELRKYVGVYNVIVTVR